MKLTVRWLLLSLAFFLGIGLLTAGGSLILGNLQSRHYELLLLGALSAVAGGALFLFAVRGFQYPGGRPPKEREGS